MQRCSLPSVTFHKLECIRWLVAREPSGAAVLFASLLVSWLLIFLEEYFDILGHIMGKLVVFRKTYFSIISGSVPSKLS